MFHVNQNGVLTLDAMNKNAALIRVNGIIIAGKKQLRDGDVLSIGKYSSVSWMTLHVKTRRVVTPEIRKLPMKKLIKRRKEADGMGQEYETFGCIKTFTGVRKQPPAAAPCLHKVSPRKRLCVQKEWTGTPSSPLVELSHPKSQDDLFSSNESNHVPSVTPQKRTRRSINYGPDETDDHLPKVTPQPRMTRVKLGNEDEATNKDNRKTSGDSTRISLMSRYPSTKTRATSWGDDSSPESRERDQLGQAGLVDDERYGSTGSRVDLMEHASSTSSKTSLETQCGQNGDSPPCPVVEGTILSLPQCPTYDGESSDMGVKSHCIHEENNIGELFAMHESGQETDDTATILATDLSTKDWADFCTHDDAVRRSLANLIVVQRSLRQDNDWLPDLIQGAVVD
jgi:hypothetical protein